MITWYLPPPGAGPWTWPRGPARFEAVDRWDAQVAALGELVGRLAAEADAGAALAERLAGSLPGP